MKKNGCLKVFLFLLLLVGLGVVLIAGYFNLIPSVSNILGTNKNKDLGIKYDDKTVEEMSKLSGIKLEKTTITAQEAIQNAQKYSPKYTGSKNLKISLSSEDLTAWIRDRGWPYYPISNGQIRVNTDGTVEGSAILRIGRLASWINATGGDGSVVDLVRQKLPIPLIDLPVYAKGNLNVVENSVNLNFMKLQVGKLSVPTTLISKYNTNIENFVGQRMHYVPGLYVKKLDFTGGKMHFEGTAPEKETVAIVK